MSSRSAAEHPRTVDPTLTRLARGGTLNLVGALVSGLLAALVTVIVARHYARPVAGAFFAATALFLILSAVAELGVDTGLLRWLPRYAVEKRYDDMHTCVRIAMRPVYVASVAVGVVVFVAAPWIASASVDGAQKHAFTGMLRVLAVGLPIAAAYDLVLAQTRVYGSMRPTVVVEKLGRSVAQPVAIVIVEAMHGGAVALAVAWTAPYIPAMFAAIAWNGRVTHAHRAKADVSVPARPVAEVRGEFWRYTTPRAAARIFQVALQRADIVLVAALRSPKEAAVYAAASRLLVFGQLGTLAVQQVMQPHLSRLLAADDHARATKVFQTSTAWLMAFAWPAYLASAAAAPLLLSVFGPGYSGGQATLVILSLTMLLATACGPVDIVLLMGGRSGLSLFNNFAALVVDIVLNFVLIPKIGITGAAVSWAAALVVRNVLPLWQVRSMLNMSPVSTGSIWVALSAAACFGVVPAVARATVGLGLGVALPVFGVCSAAYLGLLWLGRRHLALDAFAGLLRRRVAAVAVNEDAAPAAVSG
ncbi:MAG: lipopolysaccharide biosynthesis protein [Actinomycetes bacterium]